MTSAKLSNLRLRVPVRAELLRQGPLREGTFSSRLRSIALTARVGTWLGVFLTIAFFTGLASHLAQHPLAGVSFPTRPVQLYRFTQGLHVATGLACIPLLLVKMWSVYPRLWQWPPVRSALHGLERASILLLVGSAVLQLFSGLTNIFYWYPWRFFFTTTHYWTAWLLAGSVLLHVAVKWPRIVEGWWQHRHGSDESDAVESTAEAVTESTAEPAGAPAAAPAGLSRRGLLLAAGAGMTTVAAVTIGETVRPLAALDLLGPRRAGLGPQGVPINKTSREAGVQAAARSTSYRLTVTGNVADPLSLTLEQLQAMTQHAARLPIACVEGWSTEATWTGVPIADLLAQAGAMPGRRVRVVSIQRYGRYRSSELEPDAARDRLTLLALALNGAELSLDHGYPCRLIAPNRPGVLQTKWVQVVEVL